MNARTTANGTTKRLGALVPGSAVMAIAMIALAVGTPGPVHALQTSSDAELTREAQTVAERAEGRIRSPFCPGLMLEVCPRTESAALRDTIRDWASDGMDEDSIVALVVARYGEEYRGYPQAEGKGWLAWLVPPGAILLGILAVAGALKRLKRTGEERAIPITDVDADEVRQAMRDLEEAEGSLF